MLEIYSKLRMQFYDEKRNEQKLDILSQDPWDLRFPLIRRTIPDAIT